MSSIKVSQIKSQIDNLNQIYEKNNKRKKIKKFKNIVSFDNEEKVKFILHKNGLKIGKFPFMNFKEQKC